MEGRELVVLKLKELLLEETEDHREDLVMKDC